MITFPALLGGTVTKTKIVSFFLTVAKTAESLTRGLWQALVQRCPKENCNGRKRERRERKGEHVIDF